MNEGKKMAVTILKGKTGVVMNYKRGRHNIHPHHILLNFGLAFNEAPQLIGKIVDWVSPAGRVLSGKIVSLHGRKGVVRAIFEKGLPGEALGTQVIIR